MIAGLEEISKGDVPIDGNKVNDIPPKNRDIAMVFQNYALYPHMSVYDNMAFGLELRKYPKAEIKKRVLEAAGILGIEQFLDRRPRHCREGSGSVSRSAGQLSDSLKYFSSTSRSPIWMLRCGFRCARR